MSLFTPYFSNIIGVHDCTGVNDCGDTVYDPPLGFTPNEVECRIEYNLKEIIDSKGNKAISTATVFSDEIIAPLSIVFVGDTRYTVKSCSPITDLMGNVDHYEISL